MRLDQFTKCAYSAENRCVIDLMLPCALGYRSQFERESIDEMRRRYPDVQLTTLDDATSRIEQAFRSGPVEISRDEYCEMLEVLPPVDWTSSNGWESFKMVERTSGNITNIYATDGTRYFCLSDSIYMPHRDIIAACEAA